VSGKENKPRKKNENLVVDLIELIDKINLAL